jgi:ribonuclease HI
MAQITIYTDGAAIGNPGPGGYGIVLISGAYRKEVAQGFTRTTNNRMELMAVIVGLEMLKNENCDVSIYSDSKYVVDSISKGWVFNWQKKGFKDKKNVDLWVRFLKVFPKHKIKVIWVKGHANIPENERCDQLATQAARSQNLIVDTGYVVESNSGLFS